MINERIALVMLDGNVPDRQNDPHHARQFYKSMQAFADASLKLCDAGQFKKPARFLHVAAKLFREGNETVKNGIINVYLFTLSRSLDQQPAARKWIEPFMSKELRTAYESTQCERNIGVTKIRRLTAKRSLRAHSRAT